MENNDFVKINYIGRIKGTNEIFDLTREETAKKEGIYKQGQKYGPVTIIVGAGHLVKGLDEAMHGLKAGEKKSIELKTADAFGERKAERVKVFTAGQFKNSDVPLVPGVTVNMGNLIGRIQSVSGGRVRIDFNHPLAGKDLLYEVEVLEKIDKKEEKAKALLDLYGVDSTKTGVKISGDTLEIEVPEGEQEKIAKTKKAITEEMLKYIKEIKTVKITDIYKKKER